MNKLLTASLLVALIGTAASAAIVLDEGSTYRLHVSDPVFVGMDGGDNLYSVRVTIENISGNPAYNANTMSPSSGSQPWLITAVDGAGNPMAGLHQDQVVLVGFTTPNFEAVEEQSIAIVSYTNQSAFLAHDTHWLCADLYETVIDSEGHEVRKNYLEGYANPSEDAADDASAVASGLQFTATSTAGNTGYGQYLTGGPAKTSLAEGGIGTSWEFAQIVAKEGQMITVGGEFYGGGHSEALDGTFTIPEPGTMSLLALGAAALVRRRRRR